MYWWRVMHWMCLKCWNAVMLVLQCGWLPRVGGCLAGFILAQGEAMASFYDNSRPSNFSKFPKPAFLFRGLAVVELVSPNDLTRAWEWQRSPSQGKTITPLTITLLLPRWQFHLTPSLWDGLITVDLCRHEMWLSRYFLVFLSYFDGIDTKYRGMKL